MGRIPCTCDMVTVSGENALHYHNADEIRIYVKATGEQKTERSDRELAPTPEPESLREALKAVKLSVEDSEGLTLSNVISARDLDEILLLFNEHHKLLLDGLLEKLPEQHTCDKTCKTGKSVMWIAAHNSWITGYNQALTEVHEAIKAVRGEL